MTCKISPLKNPSSNTVWSSFNFAKSLGAVSILLLFGFVWNLFTWVRILTMRQFETAQPHLMSLSSCPLAIWLKWSPLWNLNPPCIYVIVPYTLHLSRTLCYKISKVIFVGKYLRENHWELGWAMPFAGGLYSTVSVLATNFHTDTFTQT